MQNDSNFESLLDVSEAAEVLRLHPDTVKKMAQRRQLPAIKLGKYWRFRLSDLDAWIRSKTIAHQPERNRRTLRSASRLGGSGIKNFRRKVEVADCCGNYSSAIIRHTAASLVAAAEQADVLKDSVACSSCGRAATEPRRAETSAGKHLDTAGVHGDFLAPQSEPHQQTTTEQTERSAR